MRLTTGLKATGNIVQETPQDFFDWLNSIFRFDLDVCALPENAKCGRYFTPETDGLGQDWMGGGMVQSSIRKRNHPVGQEGFGGIRETLLPLRRHASPREDGYEMVSEVRLQQGFPLVRGRKTQVRRKRDKRAFSEHGRGLYQAKAI